MKWLKKGHRGFLSAVDGSRSGSGYAWPQESSTPRQAMVENPHWCHNRGLLIALRARPEHLQSRRTSLLAASKCAPVSVSGRAIESSLETPGWLPLVPEHYDHMVRAKGQAAYLYWRPESLVPQVGSGARAQVVAVNSSKEAVRARLASTHRQKHSGLPWKPDKNGMVDEARALLRMQEGGVRTKETGSLRCLRLHS